MGPICRVVQADGPGGHRVGCSDLEEPAQLRAGGDLREGSGTVVHFIGSTSSRQWGFVAVETNTQSRQMACYAESCAGETRAHFAGAQRQQ